MNHFHAERSSFASNNKQQRNAPTGQRALSPGHRPGYVFTRQPRPVSAKAFVGDMLLPLQGGYSLVVHTQGAALG